jgi:ligand-binding SRPBCC domain-containing protein
MSRIVLETMIHAPILRVFDLARDVGFHESSASWTNETAVAGVTSGLLELHDTVTWRARHLAMWHNMTVQITEFESPTRFVDQMTQGPFRSLRHTHLFEAFGGDTKMTDEFEFAAPFGSLGRIVELLYLGGYMKSFLLERNRRLKLAAEASV